MNWPRVRVGDLISGPLPRTNRVKTSDYQATGQTPVVDQSRAEIAGFTDDPDARFEAPLPVVVFGDHTRILKYVDFPFARGADGTQILRAEPETVDPRYFYYALHTVDLSSYGYARHFKYLKEETIPLPPLPIQRDIANVLARYDDLISNNRQRMALAEESAHLMFREWFVYLRFPGHERAAVLNGVPDGWRRSKVGDLLAKVPTRRKIPKGEYQEAGSIPTIDQSRDFIGGFTDDLSSCYTAECLPLVVFGDHTRILKYVDFPFARGADGTQVLSPGAEGLGPQFLYFALSAIDLSGFGYARHFKYLKAAEVLIPESSLIAAFDDVAMPILQQISLLREQSRKLREARDLLLPRLIDGRIPV